MFERERERERDRQREREAYHIRKEYYVCPAAQYSTATLTKSLTLLKSYPSLVIQARLNKQGERRRQSVQNLLVKLSRGLDLLDQLAKGSCHSPA